MTTDKTIDQQLQDLETLPEAELLAIPQENIAPALLAAIWNRTITLKEEKDLNDAVVRHDARQQRTEESIEHDRERRREQALEQFRETMREVEERSERLLQRIEEQKRVARKQLEEIDSRAILLRDGRRAFVGEHGDYFDESGRTLDGADAREARQKEKPDSAQWKVHDQTRQRYDALDRLEENVRNIRDDARKTKGEGLNNDELRSKTSEQNDRIAKAEVEFESTRGDLAAQDKNNLIQSYDADYTAYEAPPAPRTASYSGTLDGDHVTATRLSDDFAPAATGAGQGLDQKAVDSRPSGNKPLPDASSPG